METPDVGRSIDLLVLSAGTQRRHWLVQHLTAGPDTEVHHAFVATQHDSLVGAAHLISEPAFGTVSACVAVAPGSRGQGIGTALANELDLAARRLRPSLSVTSTLRDDLEQGRRFAQRYGLAVTSHSVGWRFDLTGAVGDLAERAARSARQAGVRVRRADLVAEEADVLDCIGRSMAGLPLPGRAKQEPDLTQIRRRIPDDALVLLAESDAVPYPVGTSIITPQADLADWYTVYTGVVVAHRGQGIAGALKAAAMLAARDAGAPGLTTHNDDTNEAILRTNRRFGMRPSVGFWTLTRYA
ncbi:GNAT family N-acetyltransferase [Micromonospora sp. NPDC049559]|uniref:GNAT family N-acetyltransferase n=1 Tax=Micromonospora sp. NPDC049559 TaxID=3155923 RepID=UPI00341204C1